jgi:hypothetical protein
LRVVAILAVWAVVAVLATLFFALGGSLGYRRGVKDTLEQVRQRRTGKKGCRPMPANHLRRRTSGHARPGAKARRARWYPGPVTTAHATPVGSRRRDPKITLAVSTLAAVLLLAVPGTAIGATTAQPGEPLWRLKIGLERARVTLASGGAQGAEVHVDLASVRLAELHGLVAHDLSAGVVAEVSDDLRGHVTAATDALGEVTDPAHRVALQRRLELVTARQVDVMNVLVGTSDCTGGPRAATEDCAALEETRDTTVALHRATDAAVSLAEPVPPPVIVQDDAAGASGARSGVVPGTVTAPNEDVAVADQQDAPSGDRGSVAASGTPGGGEASAPSSATAGTRFGAGSAAEAQESESASPTQPADQPGPTPSPSPTPSDEATPPATPAAADAADAAPEAPAADGAPAAEAPDTAAEATGDTAAAPENVTP